MPYYFNYYNPETDERILQKKMHTGKCQGITKTGQRCKRTSIIGFEYCNVHLESVKHLKIKESNIINAGKGLFAYDRNEADNAIIFKIGNTIIDYNGELIDNDEKYNRYENFTAPYAVEISNNVIVDSSIKRGIGSLSNNVPRTRANAKLSSNYRYRTVNIKAIKNIRNGEEILINYGNDYDFENNFNVKKYKTLY